MSSGIKITGVDLVKFTQAVYELSRPQGMGFIHFKSGGLSDEDAREIVNNSKPYGGNVLSMDYVHGRACKMNVFKEGNDLYIADSWYDHTDEQLKTLLQKFNIEMPVPAGHGVLCNCADCRRK